MLLFVETSTDRTILKIKNVSNLRAVCFLNRVERNAGKLCLIDLFY